MIVYRFSSPLHVLLLSYLNRLHNAPSHKRLLFLYFLFVLIKKVYHKRNVNGRIHYFVFARSNCHLTIITLIPWIKIDCGPL